jgi:hypothetical protein
MARLAVSLGVALAVVAGTSGATAALAVDACGVPTALPAPPVKRPHYELRIRVAPSRTAASGTVAVTFAPEVATDRLVFRLWPNSPFYARRGARLTVTGVARDGRPVTPSRPDPTTLVVGGRLGAGEQTTVSMTWVLRLPRAAGLQLHGGRSLRLLSFFPVLGWNGSTWATEGPVALDSFWPTSPTADFDVRVSVPKGLRVLASGRSVAAGRWRAEAVRDFALAVGSFQVQTRVVMAPRPVRVVVGLERGSSSRASDFLVAAANALRFYAERYGDYPWPTYSLAVMRDFRGLAGAAYPTLGFFGDGSLVLVPHETAHQWFYSLVGNDQSRDPWLSEGLASWAQTGPEQSLEFMLATSIPRAVMDRIGEPMSFWQRYDFDTIHAGLYVQSVQALGELGDAATVDCALRRFVVANAYRTVTPRDLLAALEPDFPDAATKLQERGARF